MAPFQIHSFSEAVNRALSIEREDEDILAIREQMGRNRQVPQYFQARQDFPKRQMVSNYSGKVNYRPTGQQWRVVRPTMSQQGLQAGKPSGSQYNKAAPSVGQPLSVRPQGQVSRPQGKIVRLQQVQRTRQWDPSQMTCFSLQ